MEMKTVLVGFIVVALLGGVAVGYLMAPSSDPDLESQVNALQSQVANLETQIMEKNSQIGNLSALISSLESQIANNPPNGNFSALILSLQSQVADLEAQIEQKNAQITSLNDTIRALQEQIGGRKGEYNLVATFSGEQGVTTDYFFLNQPDIMVVWNWTTSTQKPTHFTVTLYKQGQSNSTQSWADLSGNGSTYVHNIQAAYYYLGISESNIDSWNVTIYQWVPE